MKDKNLASCTKKNGQQTTPYVLNLKSRFTVIHPFHPLRGRRFELIEYRNVWKKRRVQFLNDQGTVSSIPLEWTDAAGVDLFVHYSNGRSVFRAEDLVRLADLIADLSAAQKKKAGKRCVNEIMSKCKGDYVTTSKQRCGRKRHKGKK